MVFFGHDRDDDGDRDDPDDNDNDSTGADLPETFVDAAPDAEPAPELDEEPDPILWQIRDLQDRRAAEEGKEFVCYQHGEMFIIQAANEPEQCFGSDLLVDVQN